MFSAVILQFHINQSHIQPQLNSYFIKYLILFREAASHFSNFSVDGLYIYTYDTLDGTVNERTSHLAYQRGGGCCCSNITIPSYSMK